MGKGLGVRFGAAVFLGLVLGHAAAAETPEARRWQTVMPLPSLVQAGEGTWTAPPVVLVDWGTLEKAEQEDLADRLDRTFGPLGRRWRTYRPPEVPRLVFSSIGPTGEGYSLEVSPQRVQVSAADPAGRFYALVTLAQGLPPRARSSDPVRASSVRIADIPAYGWRGLMVDSARHFLSVGTIEWVLELMALHKLNRLHWHLTDDQGWRFEVPGWPRLTEVGAWRTEADGRRYGGFYSAAEVARIVAFAARRHIVLVPEVDLPGHASAALAAYPELSALDTHREVPTDWAIADGVLSIGRPEVTRFTADVLGALVTQFPGPWIHWGGDEVYRTPWMRNAQSLAWMRSVKASTPDQALAAFWKDLAARTLAAGRIPVGWDEVALMAPPPGTVVQWWDDPARATEALKAGLGVIASWKESSYLDYPEWDGDGDRAFWMPIQTLETVAAQPFWPPGTPEPVRDQILGVEATLFSERVTESKVGRKLFPRLSLVAELAWRGDRGGTPGWPQRIADHRDRLTAWGVGMPPPAR